MKDTYGILGYPLSHSFSPNYFKEKFKREGILDTQYVKFETLDPMFFMAKAMEDLSIKGFNVTIPYKQQVIQFLDSIDEDVREIGAVNTVKRTSNGWVGYNTDVYGFKNSFAPLLQPNHKKALILGSGGAASAIRYVLGQLRIPFLVVSRSLANGHVTYKDVSEALLKQYSIIINCTPVGTHPNINELPELPYQYITENHYLYDLVYNPAVTMFLSKGKNVGATIKNGLEMLELQAERSWEIWKDNTL